MGKLFWIVLSLLTTGILQGKQRLDEQSEWPSFRGDNQNSGQKDYLSTFRSELKPWSFQTTKGIFSSPVIDEGGNAYIGSADKSFYKLSSEGQLLWSYQTGEIIDSAAVLSRDDNGSYVTIPSGDGHLYHYQRNDEMDLIWDFSAHEYPHPKGKGYTWFEGNVAIGPDGNFYAGNTNWNFYSITGDGDLRWAFPAGNMNWSIPSFNEQGDLFWSSLDFKMRRMSSSGEVQWQKSSWGFNVASMALSPDGLVIGASFDNYVYGLDQETGKKIWAFKTNGHIYGSPALSAKDMKNKQSAHIYVSSTDGFLYKLSPQGELIWKFDVGDTIRSSPVVNLSEELNDIIYFGCGDGKLYAINGDGSFRWSYNTTEKAGLSSDRNDLNASPALGKKGIYIAGEHGYLWFVPYDYPLYSAEIDPRASNEWQKAQDGISLQFISNGGNLITQSNPVIDPSSIITLRVNERENGNRNKVGLNTWFGASKISIEPATPFTWEVSAAADTVYIRPVDFWDLDTQYTIKVDGQILKNGLQLGNLEIGAREFEKFKQDLSFRTESSDSGFSLENKKFQFELTRLSVPEPNMLPSLNQIGFDSYNLVVSLIENKPLTARTGELLAWVQGGLLDENGSIRLNSTSEFSFPLKGIYKDNHFVLRAENIPFEVGGISIKQKVFEVRGSFEAQGVVGGQSSLYVESNVLSDLSYGPALGVMGLLNLSGKLPTIGTFITKAINQFDVPSSVDLDWSTKDSSLGMSEVAVSIKNNSKDIFSLMIIGNDGKPLFLDYPNLTTRISSENGQQILLKIPRFSALAKGTQIVLLANSQIIESTVY